MAASGHSWSLLNEEESRKECQDDLRIATKWKIQFSSMEHDQNNIRPARWKSGYRRPDSPGEAVNTRNRRLFHHDLLFIVALRFDCWNSKWVTRKSNCYGSDVFRTGGRAAPWNIALSERNLCVSSGERDERPRVCTREPEEEEAIAAKKQTMKHGEWSFRLLLSDHSFAF